MSIGSVIRSGVNYAREHKKATILLLAFQGVAAVDQFQYEAAYNEPEDFSVVDVATDIMFGNILNFGPTLDHIDRALGADEQCANQGQLFNNGIAVVNDIDPSGLSEFGALWVRFAHWGSIPGAEIGSFAYETYDTGLKLLYDADEREPGACVID